LNFQSGNAAVLWTGGKDSCLALYQAQKQGYKVERLVTFVPTKPDFLAHPLLFMQYQAKALNLPHDELTLTEPFKPAYEQAIGSLKRQGISTLITGDIAEVGGQPNWVRECSQISGMEILTPLWGWDRQELLAQLLSTGFKAIFSCVKKPWFTEEWLGREIDANVIDELRKISAETGLDIGGEQGEYHTLVTDGPLFAKRIQIEVSAKRAGGELMYLDIRQASLREKIFP